MIVVVVFFLGKFEEYDLYFCKQGVNLPTVLARFSDVGYDYLSGMVSSMKPLIVTKLRAFKKDLISEEEFIKVIN